MKPDDFAQQPVRGPQNVRFVKPLLGNSEQLAAAKHERPLGLVINAGHGLHYGNVTAIAEIDQIVELNIGHAIIARAVFEGLRMAVIEMKRLMAQARSG